jgi:uncharacterized membrane protein
MHPMRRPVYAIAIGVLFIVLGIVYYAVPTITGGHVDWSGAVMLAALGIAIGLMAYVLMAGSPSD